MDLLPFRFLLRPSPLSPLTVLSTSFFSDCYPFVGTLTVCCFVYTCVYSCVPTCTLLYTRVYTEAFITTSFRGAGRLYEWALLGSPERLVLARRMDTSLYYGRVRSSTTEGFVSTLQLAFSRHRPYTPINNVPACEGIGKLRYDLDLW